MGEGGGRRKLAQRGTPLGTIFTAGFVRELPLVFFSKAGVTPARGKQAYSGGSHD
jgi:hypothetical protein